MSIKLVNVSKVHNLVPSIDKQSVNAKYCAVNIIVIFAADSRRPNEQGVETGQNNG